MNKLIQVKEIYFKGTPELIHFYPKNHSCTFFHRFMHIFIHIIIIAIKIALNDADNFKDTCINTAIDTISATIASTSKNGNSDSDMTAFRVQSSA
jgi:hypothetical protein